MPAVSAAIRLAVWGAGVCYCSRELVASAQPVERASRAFVVVKSGGDLWMDAASGKGAKTEEIDR